MLTILEVVTGCFYLLLLHLANLLWLDFISDEKNNNLQTEQIEPAGEDDF